MLGRGAVVLIIPPSGANFFTFGQGARKTKIHWKVFLPSMKTARRFVRGAKAKTDPKLLLHPGLKILPGTKIPFLVRVPEFVPKMSRPCF